MNEESAAASAGPSFERFVLLIARLRGPGGCPWDREQTHASLKAMTIEEAYEVVEAIDHGDAELRGELGDLLLQVVFHAQIAAETGRFTIGDVIDGVSQKMVRRHPHVFGDVQADSSAEVLRNWETLKQEERRAQGKSPATESMLDSVAKALPATMEAFQMTTKAARVGFDWPNAGAVFEKIGEEIAELRAAASHEEREDEVGDLLFAVVNLARKLGVDPESALKSSNRKFRRRFRGIEEGLRRRGKTPAESSLQEMDALWDEVKQQEEAR